MTADAGLFSPEDARTILQVVRQVQQSGILSPAYIDRIVRRLPRNIGGDSSGDGALFLTPSGGIPAMTGNGPWVWGVASCNRIDTDGELTESTADVHNSVSGAIPGNRVIQASKIYGKWFANVVDCASSTGIDDDDGGTVPPGPDPEPPIDIGV